MTHAHPPGRITDTTQIQNFMIAGHAIFTLVSTKSQNRYTYKVKAVPDSDERFFVSVLSGPDNETDYVYIGMLFDNTAQDNGLYFKPKRPEVGTTPLGTTPLQWFTNHLRHVDELPDSIEFWHEGSCAACGRRLTTPESIERGFGPVCAEKVGG